MKQTPTTFLKKELSRFPENCVVVRNFLPHTLPDLCAATDIPIFLCVDDDVYTSVAEQSPLSWENERVLWVPPNEAVLRNVPPGFTSEYELATELLGAVASSLWSEIKMIICASSEKNISLPAVSSEPLRINSSTGYDLLISFLCDNGFAQHDVVLEKNQFAVRGAIVDFFPLTSSSPVRVSFYGDVALSLFDIDTQLSGRILSSLLVPAKPSHGDRKCLLDRVDGDFLNCLFSDGTLKLGGSATYKSIDYPFSLVSFEEYYEKYRDQPVTMLNYPSMSGHVGFGSIFIPDWFQGVKKGGDSVDTQPIKPSFTYASLSVGDYVVHQDCGVGLFRGLKVLELGGGDVQEQLVLEYANGGLVSVDINHLHKLSHYSSNDGSFIDLDSLGKRGLWEKKKRAAKKQADEVVASLLSAYAIRRDLTRPPMIGDVDLESLFIKQFPYEETPDQRRAWVEISDDLSGSFPMDRLLCGDVGFGKTEVAIRCAFRAVLSGRRVLVLSPTTILAQQLELAFKGRLSPFGVSVASVSRFKTKKQVEKIKLAWVGRKLDVLVGTHTVFYDDIYLNNNGLLIVDEEHRFGVKQKEKIRAIKRSIDVLSMSATPIPRTLNLALSGIRKISTLRTPPRSRLAVDTHVFYFNDSVIRRGVMNELSRGGQVFFVHNDVKTLPNLSGFLENLIPTVSVGVIHGQMPSRQIESVMGQFLKKNINLLLCTSIIETGIDISNANTIFINNAHNFGLSQLYQIRGRVGRGDRQAHAFLLLPSGRSLKRDAFKRLKAIEENTRLGAGYNISSLDLEIRGAGSLFGYRQSGGSGRVGFELYSSFINEAVSGLLLKGSSALKPQDVIIDLYSNPIIPETYIESPDVRLSFYRKLSVSQTTEDIEQISYELIDRFGPGDKVIFNLLELWRLKIKCALAGVSSLEKEGSGLCLGFSRSSLESSVDLLFKMLPLFCEKNGLEYYFKTNSSQSLEVVFEVEPPVNIIKKIFSFLDKFSTLLKT